MEKIFNPVQSYLDEINKIEIPNDEKNILDFLGSLDSNLQHDRYIIYLYS